jgi:23S rRNA (uracil1939-C5)-methyltransferase
VSTDPTIAPTTVETGAKRPNVRDELELRIESLAFGGNGVGRLQLDDRRYVVFVRGAVPGDLVRAVVTKRKRDYAEARTIEVLEAGPDRIEAVADHPGAPWQVLAYDTQVAIKQTQVDDALRRLGKLDGFELEPIVTADQQWRYRNKLEYSFGLDEAGTLVCGFHAPGSWSRILHVEDCLLASERGNEIRRAVLEVVREMGLSAYDRRTHQGFLRNLVVREGRRTGQFQVRLVTSAADWEEDDAFAAALEPLGIDSLIWTQAAGVAETTEGGLDTLLAGRERIEEELSGMRFALSAEAFFQTNTEMAERLYGVVSEFAALKGWERVYDLCCGIGTIGLTLAPRASEVIGVEIVEQAVTDAHANARANEISNARFLAGDVRAVLKDLAEDSGPRPDVIVVDPPRAGLSKKVVERIAEASPKRIVYVSCNPTTLAPNAAQLVEAGYRLVKVRPVDMFPQTPHIECVALLERA